MIYIPLRVFGFVIAISAVGVAMMVLTGVSEKGNVIFIFVSHVVVGITGIAYSKLSVDGRRS